MLDIHESHKYYRLISTIIPKKTCFDDKEVLVWKIISRKPFTKKHKIENINKKSHNLQQLDGVPTHNLFVLAFLVASCI